MCTSIVVNREKAIVGWNLDLLGMDIRVTESPDGVFIEAPDETHGWLPLFGANCLGDFVGMPTCWPHDSRSDPPGTSGDATASGTAPEPSGDPSATSHSIMMLDIDLILQKRTLQEIREIAQTSSITSLPGVTFMGALSDRHGNVLHIVPGQGIRYYEHPRQAVLTNFSPFAHGASHPWMGADRFETAQQMLSAAGEDFSAADCFDVLRAVAQQECPTVVSMVFDVSAGEVYWCLNQRWDQVFSRRFENYV